MVAPRFHASTAVGARRSSRKMARNPHSRFLLTILGGRCRPGVQAGENAIHAVVTAVGFTGFRRAAETQVQPGLRCSTIAIGTTRPEPASSGAHALLGRRREIVSRNRKCGFSGPSLCCSSAAWRWGLPQGPGKLAVRVFVRSAVVLATGNLMDPALMVKEA